MNDDHESNYKPDRKAPKLRSKKPPRGAKKSFVLGLPDLSSSEVVERGKQQGIHLNVHQVGNIRWQDKQHKQDKEPVEDAAAKTLRAEVPAPISHSKEKQLFQLMGDIGLDRTEVVFESFKRRLLELVGHSTP